MARIVRTQIEGFRPVYIGIAKPANQQADYVLREEGTGLILGALHRSANGRDWRLVVREGVTEGEESQVMVPTLFAAAQVIGHARAAFLRRALAVREAVLQDRVVGL